MSDGPHNPESVDTAGEHPPSVEGSPVDERAPNTLLNALIGGIVGAYLKEEV